MGYWNVFTAVQRIPCYPFPTCKFGVNQRDRCAIIRPVIPLSAREMRSVIFVFRHCYASPVRPHSAPRTHQDQTRLVAIAKSSIIYQRYDRDDHQDCNRQRYCLVVHCVASLFVSMPTTGQPRRNPGAVLLRSMTTTNQRLPVWAECSRGISTQRLLYVPCCNNGACRSSAGAKCCRELHQIPARSRYISSAVLPRELPRGCIGN